MIFSPHFHFKAFPEKERERERVRARAREEKKPNSQSISRRRRSPVRAPGGAISRRSLSQIVIARSRRRELAPQIAISDRDRRRDLAPSRDRASDCDLRSRSTARDRAVARSRSQIDRDLAPSRARAVDREIAPARSRSQIAIIDGIFLGFVFSFFISKHQKIFSGKFFEMQPNTEKYFPFPEISISGKYVFSGKHFTATKHSLSVTKQVD